MILEDLLNKESHLFLKGILCLLPQTSSEFFKTKKNSNYQRKLNTDKHYDFLLMFARKYFNYKVGF